MKYLAKNYKKEEFQKYAAAIIGAYQDTIEVYKAIKEVGVKMNGKVLNKRFITAVKEKVKNATISMSDQYNLGYHDIEIYIENRSININDTWIYFDNQLCCKYIHNVEKSFCEFDENANARIVCEKVESTCDKYIEMCCEHIRKWEDAAENFDKYTEQIKNAVREFGKAVEGLNDCFMPSEIYKYDWEHAE